MYVKRSTGVFKVITIRDGYSTAVVQLFRRYAPTQAEPTPALPTGTLTYTFSTGVLSGTTASFNGWSQQIPAATDGTKLFVTMATARSQGATDDIIVDSSVTPPVNEWSTPVEYVADGMVYAPVTIYKRSATAPNDKPDNNARYYFKTVGSGASQIKAGTLVAPSGGSLNGWSTIIPASNGLPCWTRQATAVAHITDDYDEIGSTEWSDPATKFVEDGTDGTSPWNTDLDNEMDSVACDATGKALALTRLYTKVSAFYGSTEKTSESTIRLVSNSTGGTVTLVSSGSDTGTGTAITSATLMSGGMQYVRVQFAKDAAVAQRGTAVLEIANATYGTRRLTFTVNGVRPGVDGTPATLYRLICKPDKVIRFKDGTLSASEIAVSAVTECNGVISDYKGNVDLTKDGGDVTGTSLPATIDTDEFSESLHIDLLDPDDEKRIIDAETIPVMADGTDGVDGQSAPYYVQEWYAWSSVAQTASITTSPFEEPYSGWSEGAIPDNTGGLAYLWRKSVKYTYNAQTNAYDAGIAQYVRLSGTNGTSIDVNGTVDYVVAAGGSLPTQGVSVGEQGIILNKNKLYSYTNMGWSQHMTNVADGDSYTVTKDNTINGVNLKGHLLMWSDEAHTADSNKGWVDLGVFQGLNGITYYTHIAWASAVTIGTTPSGHTTTGQTTTPNASAVTDFGIAPFGNAAWMGVLINTESTDSNDPLAYTWTYTKGAKGDKGDPGEDSKEREWIYKRSTTRPDTPSSFKNIVFHDMSTDAIAGMVNSSSDLPQTESEGARYVVLDSQNGKNSFYIYHDDSWDDAGGTADTADAYYFEDDGLWRMWNGQEWVEVETTDVRYDFRQVDGYVPDGWTDHAQGITDSNPTEWTSYRDYDKTAQRWGAFHTPVIWSHWGENGMDGDGVQYVFKLYASKLTTAQEESYKPTRGRQDASGEWSANNSALDPDQTGTWHDDAPSPTSSMPYCYCSVIKRINGTWGDFETLGLWSRWSEDGHNAPYEEKQYANYDSDSTNQDGEPNGNRQGNWSSSIPATSNSYPYLWERVRQRTYDANNQLISLGDNEGWTYGLLTKPGAKGSTGRMQYPAGEYSNLIKYTRTDDVCPVVHYTDGNGNDTGYWYLDADTNWEGETSDSAVAPSNTQGNPWKQAERYGMVITEALFTMFAKLGSFVVAEDFFISQYGTLFGPNGAIAVTSQRTPGSVYIGTDGLGKHIPYLALPNNVDEACYTYFSVADPMVDRLPSSGYKFRPKKVVNALTGEEYMAEGKVHVDADGNVTMRNVEVEGTIKAKTLFRTYQSLMLSHGSTDSYASHFYLCDLKLYMQGKFKNNDGTYSEITPQFTELPDVLFVGCRVPYSQSTAYTLDIPRPENYQGRQIDIYGEQNMGFTFSGGVVSYDYSIVHIQCAEDGQSGSAACFVYPFSTTPHDSVFYFNDTYYGADVHYTHLKLMSSYINGRWLWAVINMDNCHAMNFDFN